MRILYLWVNCSENGFIQKQGFNISGKYFWEFNEETKTLSHRKKEGYIKAVWNNDSIKDLSVIVGTNASGKSTLLSEIMSHETIVRQRPYVTDDATIYYGGESNGKIIVYEEGGGIFFEHNLEYEIITSPVIVRKELDVLNEWTKIFVSNSSNNPIDSVFVTEKKVLDFTLTDSILRDQARIIIEKNRIPDYVYPAEEEYDESRYYDDPQTHRMEFEYIERARQLAERINIHKYAYEDLNALIKIYFLRKSKCKKYMGKTYEKITIGLKDQRNVFRYNSIEDIFDEKDEVWNKIVSLEQKTDNIIFNRLAMYFLYEYHYYYGINTFHGPKEISPKEIRNIMQFLKDMIYRKEEDTLQDNMTTNEYLFNAAKDLLVFYDLTKDIKSTLYKQDYIEIEVDLHKNNEFFNRLLLFFEKGIPSLFMRYLTFEFKGLSSGEEALLNLYSRIFWVYNTQGCKKESLILIDEIDLYMHPKWQRGLISYLIEDIPNLIGKENKAQIIVTTHSPIILSDIPKSNILFLENKDGKCVVDNNESHHDTFGNNVHTLFLDSFFLSKDGTMGAFAENKINEIIDKLINQTKVDDEDHSILNTINIIGDDLIRRRLLELYNQKFNQDLPTRRERSQDEINAIEGSIAVLKEQIRNLEQAVVKLEQMKK